MKCVDPKQSCRGCACVHELVCVSAGTDLSTPSEDYLSTTPPALLNTIENVLAVYDNVRGGGGAAAPLVGGECVRVEMKRNACACT